jgi:hypothetical protein
MNKTVRRAGALMVAGVLTVGLGACGDDDDEADDPGAAVEDESAAADGADFCDAAVAVDVAVAGLNNGEGTPEDVEAAIAAAADAAPDEVAEAVDTMATENAAAAEAAAATPEGEGPPPMPGEAFYPASVEVGTYLSDNCDFETLDVTATEYAFDGIAESVPAGTTVINFDNQGTEFHEVAIMKVADGEERPVEELLALPDEEAMAVVTNTATVFGPPDAGTYVTTELEPGRYVAICFVPVGATPEAMETGAGMDGEPHFLHGMVTEFEVA